MAWCGRSSTSVRRIRRYFSLSPADRRLFIQAYIALLAIDLRLRTQTFRRVVEAQARTTVVTESPVASVVTERARRYAHWVEVAARHHVVRALCLHQSLVL